MAPDGFRHVEDDGFFLSLFGMVSDGDEPMWLRPAAGRLFVVLLFKKRASEDLVYTSISYLLLASATPHNKLFFFLNN